MIYFLAIFNFLFLFFFILFVFFVYFVVQTFKRRIPGDNRWRLQITVFSLIIEG
jgi:hypothetical protein